MKEIFKIIFRYFCGTSTARRVPGLHIIHDLILNDHSFGIFRITRYELNKFSEVILASKIYKRKIFYNNLSLIVQNL